MFSQSSFSLDEEVNDIWTQFVDSVMYGHFGEENLEDFQIALHRTDLQLRC